jgi:hypothetical protein
MVIKDRVRQGRGSSELEEDAVEGKDEGEGKRLGAQGGSSSSFEFKF